MTGRVSIVIATRDRAAELAGTLTRLRALHPDAPVIVVDNGSADGTPALVRRDFPDVRLIALGRNRGSAARNVGVRRADTPYVAFCDDDSWWGPGALAAAAAALDACPRLALVTARTVVGEEERPDPINLAFEESPLTAAGVPGRPVLGFLACAAVVRREPFLAACGFSPLLFFAGEESLLAYDLAAAGWALAYLDHIRVHHHPSERRAPPPRRRALERRNAVLTTWLRRPLPTALARTARLVRDPDGRRALPGVLARLPAALGARRTLPSRVEYDIRLLEAAA